MVIVATIIYPLLPGDTRVDKGTGRAEDWEGASDIESRRRHLGAGDGSEEWVGLVGMGLMVWLGMQVFRLERCLP